MVIDDKGERNEQRYELSLDDKGGDEMRVRSWTWIKRSNIEEDQYSWTRGAHKQGEQAHELSCLNLICAYSCACFICISFKIYICIACV